MSDTVLNALTLISVLLFLGGLAALSVGRVFGGGKAMLAGIGLFVLTVILSVAR